MPHDERPKVPKTKATLCAYCSMRVRAGEKSYRLSDGRYLHYRCYFPYRRLNPGGNAA